MAKGASGDRQVSRTGYENHSAHGLQESLKAAMTAMATAQSRVTRIKREIKRRQRHGLDLPEDRLPLKGCR